MGKIVFCAISSLLLVHPAVAQNADTPAGGESADPKSELAPEVTVRQQGANVVEEFRRNGRIYLIRVTPPNGQAYYIQDRGDQGEMEHSDQLDSHNELSKWRVFQW